MIINRALCRSLIALLALMALPIHAQPTSTNNLSEFAELEQPATLDVASISGSLKETIQKGQELIWHRKQRPAEAIFRVFNIAVAFIRSQIGGQVTVSFSGSLWSAGYRTSGEEKFHVIVHTKGGAVLHNSTFAVWFNCTQRIQTLHPAPQEVPAALAANVFANASSVEIIDHTEPNFPGLKIQRCGE